MPTSPRPRALIPLFDEDAVRLTCSDPRVAWRLRSRADERRRLGGQGTKASSVLGLEPDPGVLRSTLDRSDETGRRQLS